METIMMVWAFILGVASGALVVFVIQSYTIRKWKFRFRAMRRKYIEGKTGLIDHMNSKDYKRPNGTKP